MLQSTDQADGDKVETDETAKANVPATWAS